VYVSGNLHNVLRPTTSLPETALVAYESWGVASEPLRIVPTRPAMMPAIPSMGSAEQAMQDVLAGKVGAYATTLPPRRDAIDQRTVRALLHNSGGRFDQTSLEATYSDGECGETGVYRNGTPYPDSDGDGMDDTWEVAHGLNPHDPSDGPKIAANGYSNLENFLNELAGDPVAGSTRRPAPKTWRVVGK
jgi:hypothetical protein